MLTFGALAFLFDLGEEIASDAMDVEGDSRPVVTEHRGEDAAGRTPSDSRALAFALFIVLTFLPVLAGWLGQVYLICATAAGLVHVVPGSPGSSGAATIAEGRVLLRQHGT